MNEKLIDQVLQIEKQAQEIHEAARREAERLPTEAEKEAQALMEKARAEAEEEARKIVGQIKPEEEGKRILAEMAEKDAQDEGLASKNFDKAVAYVLERVIGKA